MDALNTSAVESEGSDAAYSPAELARMLQEAYLNEVHSPELQTNKQEIVDVLLQVVAQIEETCTKEEKRVKRQNNQRDIRVETHRVECERLRYMISAYLRTRIAKLERHVTDCLERDEAAPADAKLLSDAEREFARSYSDSVQNHLKKTVLDCLPDNIRRFNFSTTAPRPNRNHYVFARAKSDIRGVRIEDPLDPAREVEVDLMAGTQHILPYAIIAPHLAKDDAMLC